MNDNKRFLLNHSLIRSYELQAASNELEINYELRLRFPEWKIKITSCQLTIQLLSCDLLIKDHGFLSRYQN